MNQLFRPEAVANRARRLNGEVLLAAPLPGRLIGLVLVAIVLAAAGFAAYGSYARSVALSGWLVPDKGLIRASSPSAGAIQSLLVAEGDPVTRGQRLAEISLAAETEQGNLGEALARGLHQEAAAQKARAAATSARLEAEAEQIRSRMGHLKRELEQTEAQASLETRRVKLAQAQVDSAEPLAAHGVMPRRELEQRQAAELEIEVELAGQRGQIAAIERELADGAGRLAAIPIEIEAARAEALSADASLQQRTSDVEARRAIFVLAPVDGRVAALPVSSGQPIGAGATLAVLIPAGGRLEAELLAPSRAIGFIRPGQEVRLQLQAFPYQRFGTLAGAVKSVSATVIAPNDVAVPGLAPHEPVFRLRAALATDAIAAYGQSYPLQPGMLVSAEVVLERRSLLRWLFDPLYAVGRRT